MSIKISANQSAVAHHIIDGPFTFPYAVDAISAVSRYPGEWSFDPWSQEAEAKARQQMGEPAVEATPEEQAAIADHAKAVAEANERLKKFHAEQAEKKKIADQVAADEALVASPPPRPDLAARRPSPAQMRKRAAETDEERMVREKREADQQDAASRAGAPIT